MSLIQLSWWMQPKYECSASTCLCSDPKENDFESIGWYLKKTNGEKVHRGWKAALMSSKLDVEWWRNEHWKKQCAAEVVKNIFKTPNNN